jgi:hypothetical protein
LNCLAAALRGEMPPTETDLAPSTLHARGDLAVSELNRTDRFGNPLSPERQDDLEDFERRGEQRKRELEDALRAIIHSGHKQAQDLKRQGERMRGDHDHQPGVVDLDND